MYQDLQEVFPELKWLGDAGLRGRAAAVYEEAIQTGGWSRGELDVIPFTLLIPGAAISYRTHVRAVTQMAHQVYGVYKKAYGDGYPLNYDDLIAGALLHDVGKLLEYEKNERGEIVRSAFGKNLRHPFSGAGLAMKHGLPSAVAHIIASHAKEGDGTWRSPEAVLIHQLDMLNFDSLKSFAGMV